MPRQAATTRTIPTATATIYLPYFSQTFRARSRRRSSSTSWKMSAMALVRLDFSWLGVEEQLGRVKAGDRAAALAARARTRCDDAGAALWSAKGRARRASHRLAESPSRRFKDARSAVLAVSDLYERNTTRLREAFVAFTRGESFSERIRACYPFVRVTAHRLPSIDPRAAFGFLPEPGAYSTTVTRPDIFS